MTHIIFLIFLLFSSSAFASQTYPPGKPQARYYVGEKLVYAISYLGISVGTAQAEVKAIRKIKGRKAYPIEVHVRSARWLDWIYKVRDEHYSHVDIKTLTSLGYELKIQEGRRRRHEKIEIPLSEGILQDPISCGYWTRTLDFKPHASISISVYAEAKHWDMKVKFFEKAPIDIKNIGRFEAVRTQPMMEFQGIFIRKGQIEGWISLDERRIPLRMKVKIPVLGVVHAELKEYQKGIK